MSTPIPLNSTVVAAEIGEPESMTIDLWNTMHEQVWAGTFALDQSQQNVQFVGVRLDVASLTQRPIGPGSAQPVPASRAQ